MCGSCSTNGTKEKQVHTFVPCSGLQRVPGIRGSQISRQSAKEGGKVVSPTHRPTLPPGNVPYTDFCQRLSRPQGHGAAGRIMSIKNSNDTIGNRTRDFPGCSAVRQPTAPPSALSEKKTWQQKIDVAQVIILKCISNVVGCRIRLAQGREYKPCSSRNTSQQHCSSFNLLAPELFFFLILAHLYIKQEPNTLQL